MQLKFNQYLKNKRLSDAKLLLAISGGIDSMVLWDLLNKQELNVHLAHVNFQLRGEESDKDQALLEQIAKERGTELHILREDTNQYAKDRGLSTQIAAREIRYNWFEELIEKHHYDYLLTAHHLDDSIETFFINLNRGTGIKGLSGIQETDKILRPLLAFTKKEIQQYAKENQIAYREDASNKDSYYLRNWFRNELLPLWKTKNQQIETKMRENMLRIYEANELIEQLVKSDLEDISFNKEETEIPFSKIESMKAPKQSLMTAFEVFGFNYSQIEDLLDGISNRAVGSCLLAEEYKIIIDRTSIFLVPLAKSELVVEELDVEGELLIGDLKFSYGIIDQQAVDFKNQQAYYMDAEKLKFPLKLRSWKEGDRIQPMGMKGSKLVSDILIDEKLPLHQKGGVKILLSQEQIIAVVGYRISEKVKITERTNQVWSIHWGKI